MESENEKKITFDDALNKTGYGLYSYLIISVAGLVIISMVCIAYSSTIIAPTSACELETTTAQRGMLAAAPVVGMILGSLFWGYFADVFGRRFTLIISLVSAATVNSMASISVNWIMLMILLFTATLLASGQFPQAMTLLSESVPAAKRNTAVLLVGSIFLLAQGIMAVLAIPIIPLRFSYELPGLGIYWNSWRTILLLYSAPSLISALCLFFMHESPKFLFVKGRQTEAFNVLRKIYSMNNLGSKKELDIHEIETPPTTGPLSIKDQIFPIFRTPLLKTTITLTILYIFQQVSSFLVWLPTIADQLVKILETGEGSDLTLCEIIQSNINATPDPDAVPCSLNPTTLLIVLGIGVVQSVTNALISLIINRVGRRNMVMFVTAFCGVCGIVVNLIPNAIGSSIMFFIFLIGIVCHGLYAAMGVALFPTAYRTLAVSFTMSGNRIATFASVQILNVLLESNCEVGFYVYSAIFASSIAVAAFLADDRRLQTNENN